MASRSTPAMGTALLVQGPEALFAERAVAARVRAARVQAPDAELHHVEGAGLDAGTFAELTGGSLFSAATIVVINDISMVSQPLFPLIAGTAAQPPEDLCLVMTHPGGVRGKGLLDQLKKAKVETAEAKPIKAWQLADFVTAEAKDARVPLAPRAAQALVDAVGSDVRALAAAVTQLGSDHPGTTITAETITTYFGGRAEVTSYAVADDILAGRTGEALEKLRWALDTGTAPVQITTALAGSFRGLGKYLDVRSARMSDGEVAAQIGVPPWKVKDLARQSRSWSPAAVAASISAVAKADADVKGQAANADYALEQMVLHISAARQAR